MWSDDQSRRAVVIVVPPTEALPRLGSGAQQVGGTAMRTEGEGGGTQEALPGRNKDFLRAALSDNRAPKGE